MKKLLTGLLAVVLITSCGHHDKKAAENKESQPKTINTDTLLITDSTWGLIHRDMNFSDLQVVYGKENLKDERICGAECMDSVDVTMLYPETNNQSVIYWEDTAYHKKIAFIECFNDSAAWHTSSGLKIGSGLNELLKLNGKKISFYGFGWDYGGSITSYNNGKLESSPISFILDSATEENSLIGDIGLDTDMPAVKKEMDKIKIYWLRLLFNKPGS